MILVFVLVGCAPSPALALPTWFEEFGPKNAEEVSKKAAEREAQERETAAEHAAEEAQLKANEEAQRKVKEEEAQRASEAAQKERQAKEAESSECVVPSVTGDLLNAASNALRKAHCRLGRVTRPRSHHGVVVVTKQSHERGTRLAAGAVVAVTLGTKPRRGH